MSRIELDGTRVRSEAEFHHELSRLLDFGPYYGHNRDALWDRLSKDVERPVHLARLYADVSRSAMGESAFGGLRDVLDRAVAEDEALGVADRFTYNLA